MNAVEPDDQRASGGQAPERNSLFSELKRRQVLQSALAYGAIAWGATEILDGVITHFGWPAWLATLVVILFVVGFPVAMFLAWTLDWTPRGIRREEPWTAMDKASIGLAASILLAGTAGLFWLINPGGVAHLERVGVAVLPCRYQGPKEFAFRAEGMAGALEERLALLRPLRVPAYAAVLRLLAQQPSTAELGEQAGVAWLVECRLSEGQGGWQIEASLVDVAKHQSEPVISLETSADELYTRIDPVAQALAGKLGGVPTDQERQRWAERSSSHTRSFDAYLEGEQAMRLGTAEGYRTALGDFRKAQQGPGFALARVREAEALMGLLEAEVPGADPQTPAKLRAAGLLLDAVEASDPELAELYAARMHLEIVAARLGQGAPPQESQQRAWFERALELRPSYAEPYRRLAEVLQAEGKAQEASELLASAEVLDPGGSGKNSSAAGGP